MDPNQNRVGVFRYCDYNQHYIPAGTPPTDAQVLRALSVRPPLSRPITSHIPVSFISPQDSHPRELFRENFRCSRHCYANLTRFSKVIPPTPRNYLEEAVFLECDIFKMAFSELGTKYSVTGLDFHLIGHGFAADQDGRLDWGHNFSTYASTVKDIHFGGHFNFVTPAFQIIAQLPALKKVSFTVGFDQNPVFLESFDGSYNRKGDLLVGNPSVEVLEVTINNAIFSRGTKLMQSAVEEILELILQRSRKCFPNLKSIQGEFPACWVASRLFKTVIGNCQYQKWFNIEASFVAGEVGVIKLNCVTGGQPGKPLLAPVHDIRTLFPTDLVPGSIDHTLAGILKRIGNVIELLLEFRSSHMARKMMGPGPFPTFIFNPPTEFAGWFTEGHLFRLSRGMGDPDHGLGGVINHINEVMRSLIVGVEQIVKIRQSLKLSRGPPPPADWMDMVA